MLVSKTNCNLQWHLYGFISNDSWESILVFQFKSTHVFGFAAMKHWTPSSCSFCNQTKIPIGDTQKSIHKTVQLFHQMYPGIQVFFFFFAHAVPLLLTLLRSKSQFCSVWSIWKRNRSIPFPIGSIFLSSFCKLGTNSVFLKIQYNCR